MRLLALVVVLSAAEALAGPYCVVTSYSKQCNYFSADDCQSAADSVGGMCVVKKSKPQGRAPFCVVSGSGTACWYYDVDSCRDNARAMGGTCVPR